MDTHALSAIDTIIAICHRIHALADIMSAYCEIPEDAFDVNPQSIASIANMIKDDISKVSETARKLASSLHEKK